MTAGNRRQTGTCYEQQAAAWLEEQGYKILEHNYYCHLGEIDLIAEEGGYLVFLEVKYRRTAASGSAAESVNRAKQRRIYRCAQVYMKHHEISFYHPVRFDVLAIDGREVSLIKNAFGGM
ncbi:MAG: YraN family protein [Lachnospiraceae bacterium]|nr:YraN family protein [Lachnospiraceae bacterium]MDY4971879.1 YraN family protein [Lachnospiraceae bacterium]